MNLNFKIINMKLIISTTTESIESAIAKITKAQMDCHTATITLNRVQEFLGDIKLTDDQLLEWIYEGVHNLANILFEMATGKKPMVTQTKPFHFVSEPLTQEHLLFLEHNHGIKKDNVENLFTALEYIKSIDYIDLAVKNGFVIIDAHQLSERCPLMPDDAEEDSIIEILIDTDKQYIK